MKILITFILLLLTFSSCQQAPKSSMEYPWTPYSMQAIDNSLMQKKPIIIDFTADWCPNCHDLDRLVFSLPGIKAKLARVTALRMDVTNQDDPKVQDILNKYGIEGVPTVIFMDEKGNEIKDSRVLGFVSPREFSQSLAMMNIFK